MPTIRALTPPIDAETDFPIKLQTWVSNNDKRTVMSAVADDGVHTFIIRTTYKRIADFIRTNDLTSYDPASYARIVEFVRNGTDTRSDRPADVKHDAGAVTRLQHKDAAAKGQSGGVGTGGKGGDGKQGKDVVKEGRKSGGRKG
jgi:hypothetical protein